MGLESRHDLGSLHDACYRGDLEGVRQLLAGGADPNAPVEGAHAFVSAAERPRPLNCVVIAHAVTRDHVSIARLLIERGAIVNDSVVADHTAESTGGHHDAALSALLVEARGKSDSA